MLRWIFFISSLVHFAGGAAQAHDLTVIYDQSRLLRLPEPIEKVVIGNPSIADVTVNGTYSLVLTGKSFGTTNLIVLGQSGEVVLEERIIVRADEAYAIRVYRGTSRQTYVCSPFCSPSLTAGDDAGFFESVASSSQKKRDLSESDAGRPMTK